MRQGSRHSRAGERIPEECRRCPKLAHGRIPHASPRNVPDRPRQVGVIRSRPWWVYFSTETRRRCYVMTRQIVDTVDIDGSPDARTITYSVTGQKSEIDRSH